MNMVHWKNNLYKNGEYNPSVSRTMAQEKARSITPTAKQLLYRDALYDFCIQKGIVKEGFRLSRTKQGIHSNIRSLITILEKNGLAEEFFSKRKTTGR